MALCPFQWTSYINKRFTFVFWKTLLNILTDCSSWPLSEHRLEQVWRPADEGCGTWRGGQGGCCSQQEGHHPHQAGCGRTLCVSKHRCTHMPSSIYKHTYWCHHVDITHGRVWMFNTHMESASIPFVIDAYHAFLNMCKSKNSEPHKFQILFLARHSWMFPRQEFLLSLGTSLNNMFFG